MKQIYILIVVVILLTFGVVAFIMSLNNSCACNANGFKYKNINDIDTDDYNINIDGINEPSLMFTFYQNFKLESNCNIYIKASELNDIPIGNTNSTNKTFFNYSNGKKINLNFSKQ